MPVRKRQNAGAAYLTRATWAEPRKRTEVELMSMKASAIRVMNLLSIRESAECAKLKTTS